MSSNQYVITCDLCHEEIPTLVRFHSGRINDGGYDYSWDYCAACCWVHSQTLNDIIYPACCACDKQIKLIVFVIKSKFYCDQCHTLEV